MNGFTQAKRIVIKVGSSTLTHPKGGMNLRLIENLVRVLSDLKNSGRELIFVSSGAVAAGMGRLGLKTRPKDMPTKQAAAAIGQTDLMYLYDKSFGEYNHAVGQVLLTYDAIEDDARRTNVHNTFQRLIELGAIPIVNENDTVSVDEIKFGDNDTLSAIVAKLVGADALVILSDIEGLYSQNPAQNPNAALIPLVTKIDDALMQSASGTSSEVGTGGMTTKLAAAKLAGEAGIKTAILNGKNPQNLYRLFDGEAVGTRFILD